MVRNNDLLNIKTDKHLILIVDDNTENLKIIANYINRDDSDIVISTNGIQALGIAEEKHPDLIILDIMMPGMDGFEVCSKLKENTATKDIPVIFITGKSEREEISRAFATGASDVILKPIISNELKAKVNNFLKTSVCKNEFNSLKSGIKRLENEMNEFLSIAAHDLKNPIYSISMLAKVIRDEKELSRDDINEFSGDIVTISERMLNLIKNILDLNAIEQGKIKISLDIFPLDELVKSVIDSYTERAAEKQIYLIYKNSCPDTDVFADRTGVIQILDNLVSNAIKYSFFNKNIWVSVSKKSGRIFIEVKDEGPGLTGDDMKKLFGKFARLSAQPTGNEQSSGLGLSIVKKYAEAMGGNVWCESVPGNGASFFVELNEKNPAEKC
jgi:two-component system, sensor histidine kinase and response regulator